MDITWPYNCSLASVLGINLKILISQLPDTQPVMPNILLQCIYLVRTYE